MGLSIYYYEDAGHVYATDTPDDSHPWKVWGEFPEGESKEKPEKKEEEQEQEKDKEKKIKEGEKIEKEKIVGLLEKAGLNDAAVRVKGTKIIVNKSLSNIGAKTGIIIPSRVSVSSEFSQYPTNIQASILHHETIHQAQRANEPLLISVIKNIVSSGKYFAGKELEAYQEQKAALDKLGITGKTELESQFIETTDKTIDAYKKFAK